MSGVLESKFNFNSDLLSMTHFLCFELVTESSPSSLMGNPSGSRHEQRSRLAAVLSDEEASSDDDLGPPIFESLPGLSRSERYMRRAQFSGNTELIEGQHSSFFNSVNGQARGLSTYRPRFLICGEQGMGQSTHIAPALLHTMEHMTVYCLKTLSEISRTSRRVSPQDRKCYQNTEWLQPLWIIGTNVTT